MYYKPYFCVVEVPIHIVYCILNVLTYSCFDVFYLICIFIHSVEELGTSHLLPGGRRKEGGRKKVNSLRVGPQKTEQP